MKVTDQELDVIEQEYSPEPIPDCVVCGAPLEVDTDVTALDDVTLACSSQLNSETGVDLSHYEKSKYIHKPSKDPRVLKMVKEIKESRAARVKVRISKKGFSYAMKQLRKGKKK